MIVIGGFFVLRSVATEEAERDIRERVVVEGQLVATALTAGVLAATRMRSRLWTISSARPAGAARSAR